MSRALGIKGHGIEGQVRGDSRGEAMAGYYRWIMTRGLLLLGRGEAR
jgi:hypothetical protein